MALSDRAAFGMVLPHRAAEPLQMEEVRSVAQRAEQLGFHNLWVTENTLDQAYSLDALVVLTYAAAVTQRIGLGSAVVVLPLHNPIHIAHQFASLDYVSNGRAILGISLGNKEDYRDFQVPLERRVRRFQEGVELIKALWSGEQISYHGEIFQLENAGIALKPVSRPHPPIWMGGNHPDAIRRAVSMAAGWMGGGIQTSAAFASVAALIRETLALKHRDQCDFTVSKRVFMSVHEDPTVARDEVQQWFSKVYLRPHLAESAGVHGTPEQVCEQLEELIDAGATHLLLNPVARCLEQVDALADVVGLVRKAS